LWPTNWWLPSFLGPRKNIGFFEDDTWERLLLNSAMRDHRRQTKNLTTYTAVRHQCLKPWLYILSLKRPLQILQTVYLVQTSGKLTRKPFPSSRWHPRQELLPKITGKTSLLSSCCIYSFPSLPLLLFYLYMTKYNKVIIIVSFFSIYIWQNIIKLS
jgi:hypothetical protein